MAIDKLKIMNTMADAAHKKAQKASQPVEPDEDDMPSSNPKAKQAAGIAAKKKGLPPLKK